jgi:hypothetical protein
MIVRLEWPEVMSAAIIGVLRQVASLNKGRSIKRALINRHAAGDENQWDRHCLGAIGECAFAKWNGVYWSRDVNTFKDVADVGEYEVRTRAKSHWDLIIRSDDPPERFYVLVTTAPEMPVFKVHGYILGADAQRDEFKQNYGGHGEAWFVPQKELLEIEPNKQPN